MMALGNEVPPPAVGVLRYSSELINRDETLPSAPQSKWGVYSAPWSAEKAIGMRGKQIEKTVSASDPCSVTKMERTMDT